MRAVSLSWRGPPEPKRPRVAKPEANPNDDAAEPVLAEPVPGDGDLEAKPEAHEEAESEANLEAESEAKSETESIRSAAVTASTWEHPLSEPVAAGSPLAAATHTLPSPETDSVGDPDSIFWSGSSPRGRGRWTEE